MSVKIDTEYAQDVPDVSLYAVDAPPMEEDPPIAADTGEPAADPQWDRPAVGLSRRQVRELRGLMEEAEDVLTRLRAWVKHLEQP